LANLGKILWVLAALAFVLAAITGLTRNWTLGVGPEGFSRACSNLALLAIGLNLVFDKWKKGS